jgi:hypothetical protein
LLTPESALPGVVVLRRALIKVPENIKINLVAESKEWTRHIAKIAFCRGKMKNR